MLLIAPCLLLGSLKAHLTGVPEEQVEAAPRFCELLSDHQHEGHWPVSLTDSLRDALAMATSGRLQEAVSVMRHWLTAWHDREVQTRMLLKGFDAVTGALRPEVLEYLAGNPVQIERATRPYQAYSDAEWSRLESACRQVVDRSRARRKEALAPAALGGEPRNGGASPRPTSRGCCSGRAPCPTTRTSSSGWAAGSGTCPGASWCSRFATTCSPTRMC